MKMRKGWICLLALAMMLASCAMARNTFMGQSSDEYGAEMAPPMAEAPAMAFEKAFAEEAAVESAEYDTSTENGTNRIVIKNASLSLVVENPIDSMQNIAKMAEQAGGFTVSSNSYKTTTSTGIEVPVAYITVRVPVEKLDETINEIKALVKDQRLDILNEEVSGQDVTSEVNDLESRLRNLQAAEEQLLEIMEDADTTEDVITIFQELTRIREEIEVIQGQIKYYRESASLSAISVNLQAKEAVEPITIGGWKPGLQAQKALQALVEYGQYLINALIWLAIFVIPFLALIFLPIYLIVRFIRKRRAGKDTKKLSQKKE